MKNINWYNLLGIAILATGMAACTDEIGTGAGALSGEAAYINIGGVTTEGIAQSVGTRAEVEALQVQKAEDVTWLQGALKQGLDITYSNMDRDFTHIIANERVAILKWTGDKHSVTGRGVYTFYYKGMSTETEEDKLHASAKWYDNGPHYFEGQYVPSQIRTTGDDLSGDDKAQNLLRDQHDDSDFDYDESGNVAGNTIGNYTLLSHYIGMPPSWYHSATIDQVLLPFKHRLSRVITYVLIDPELKTTIAGYKQGVDEEDWDNTPDDPTSSQLRFNNVKVLKYVKETTKTVGTGSAQTTTTSLTPVWSNDENITRKVIPHFMDEISSCILKDGKTLAADDEEAKEYFIVYVRKATEEKIHPRDKEWPAVHAKYLEAARTKGNGESSGYIQKKYQRVPIYDVIVRPTYTERDSVMYDEEGYYTSDKTKDEAVISRLYRETNGIDYEITLANGLTYEKRFDFDLNANWQTVVYLTIDRNGVDYDASTSEKWEQTLSNDGYYGPNNDLGHNLSMAGSSWQRAYRNSSISGPVTDGNQYAEPNDLGQYVSDAAWIEHFAQAYEGGANHGDYFILDKDITIDASQLPQNFVFTGHLNGRCRGEAGGCHKITITGVGNWVTTTNYAEDGLCIKDGDEYTPYELPDLYIPNEIAQARPRSTRASIPFGDDMMEKQSKSLAEVMTDGVTYYVKNGVDDYTEYVRPTLYRKNPACLFAGLDAQYDTKQESNPSLDYKLWEANVHKETNNGKTYWVPLKGYRAEIINTILVGGTFFPEGAVVSGYVDNCQDESGKVSNTPAIPVY